MAKIIRKVICIGMIAVLLLSSVSCTGKNVNTEPVEFAKKLKVGWNLGNTLDATAGTGLSSEISWGQPYATEELFSYIKELGFTTVRIPVSWSRHADDSFRIDEAWMDRVNEVVDYAIDSGLYVIINSHHDNSRYYPTQDNYEQASRYIETVWAQIAARFRDYDEHLVFESMNEPRLEGTDKEWWFSSGDKEGLAAIACIMKLNQLFVDTVRADGGNNATRYLMVPSCCASADYALNKTFTMPEDATGHLLLSVHAYLPYDFAMDGNGTSVWDGNKDEFSFMEELYNKFIKNGYGVVIGEFGSTNKNNLSDRTAWAKAYASASAGFGIPCILWDNGSTGSGEENFGMISRRTLTTWYPDILEALFEAYP